MKTNFPISLILVLGCLLSNMAGAEPQAKMNIPHSTTDAPMIFEVQDSYFHPKAVDLFNSYKTSLRLGRLDEAAAKLTLIQALLTTENERATFWQDAIPDIQLRTLTIIQICPDCLTGQCLTCNGQGICPACQGKKQCSACKGKKSFSSHCKACLCKACSASGICAKCKGYKFLRCPTCRGSGMGKQTDRGTPMCPQCHGKCRITCPECGGTGKCPMCAGKGRTSGCPKCNDTGFVVITCVACQGTGKCLLCDNTGVCPACKGNGICRRCSQNGMIIHYRFPVHANWVRLQAGYILHQDKPFNTNQIVEKSGSFQVFCGSREINLNVKANEIQCVSDSELYDWVRSQVLK